MERWRQEQRLAHNSTRGGSLCCMDWRTRKGWVCIYLCGILLALLYNKAVWGYESVQWSHALTVDFWQGDAWDVNEGNEPVAISFSKNVWFNAWAKKKYSFCHEGDSEVCLTLLRKQTVEAREAKRDWLKANNQWKRQGVCGFLFEASSLVCGCELLQQSAALRLIVHLIPRLNFPCFSFAPHFLHNVDVALL